MEQSEISRRNMLKGGAVGAGTLGALSMASSAAAGPPTGLAAAASGPVDMFLKIDGIPGESRDSRHPDEIEVLSFSWGVARESGKNFGRPAPQDINFMVANSKASPLLMFAGAKGTRLSTALLTVRKAGSQPLEFLKLTLENCRVTSYQTSGSSEAPTDGFSLEFERVTYSYAAQRADGSLDTPIVVTYP